MLTLKIIIAIEPLALSGEILSDAGCLKYGEALGGLQDGELPSERFS